jgi:hypothetical protein
MISQGTTLFPISISKPEQLLKYNVVKKMKRERGTPKREVIYTSDPNLSLLQDQVRIPFQKAGSSKENDSSRVASIAQFG